MFQKTIFHQAIRHFSSAFLLILFAIPISCAFAQDEDFESDKISADYIAPEIPEDADRTEKAELRKQVKAVKDKRTADKKAAAASMSGNFSASSVKPYIEGVVLPQMTFTDNNTLSNLGNLRTSFFSSYISKAPASNRQQMVNQILLPYAQRVTAGNYHPAAKLNAVLILGMMNDADPARDRMPQPSAASVNYLISVMNDADAPEFLKVGAMTGIHRNALFDSKQPSAQLDGTARTQIGTIALGIAQKNFAGQDQWTPETSYWLQRRSVQILGYLKDPGAVTAILDILSNQSEKTWLRYDAMMALKDLNLTVGTADQALEQVTTYVIDSLNSESKRLEKDLTELVSINLLYGSEDLLKSGTATEENEREIGASFGIGDNQGGGGTDTAAEELKPKLDLPIYRTNDSRRLVQGVTFNAKTVLESLENKVSAQQESVRKEIIDQLTDLISDADVGLVNLAEEKKDVKDLTEDEKAEMVKGIADRMSELFAKSAKELKANFGGGDDAEAEVLGGQ